MIKNENSIRRANKTDLEGIVELQAANQPDKGGTLSVNFPAAKIAEMMCKMPLIVSCRGNSITGFLMTGTQAMYADVPIISAMLATYPGTADSYLYGPICVSVEERGKGLAQTMFSELQRLMPGREGILFIRRNNSTSMRIHTKMGMSEVAGFVFEGVECAVFRYLG